MSHSGPTLYYLVAVVGSKPVGADEVDRRQKCWRSPKMMVTSRGQQVVNPMSKYGRTVKPSASADATASRIGPLDGARELTTGQQVEADPA